MEKLQESSKKPEKKRMREKESSPWPLPARKKNENEDKPVPPVAELDFESDASCLEASDYYDC